MSTYQERVAALNLPIGFDDRPAECVGDFCEGWGIARDHAATIAAEADARITALEAERNAARAENMRLNEAMPSADNLGYIGDYLTGEGQASREVEIDMGRSLRHYADRIRALEAAPDAGAETGEGVTG